MANEQRLIDANALMDEFRRYMVERYDREKCVSAENCKTCETGCLWWKKVCAAPTVDAVEVVRCKDCVYNENGCCTHSEVYDDTRYRPDFFCADGERRNDV